MTSSQKEQYAKVFAEFDGKITREELKNYQDKYISFDKNDDGFIDLQELKVAQEKLGQAKTHQQVVDLMKQMAADPEKGITLRDFVVVQLLGKGIQVSMKNGEKYKMGDIPPMVTDFVKQVDNYDVGSIKNFFEEKAKLEKAKKEREAKIEEERQKVKDSKGGISLKEKLEREKKAKEELDRLAEEEERKKKEHEEKRKAFAQRFNQFSGKVDEKEAKKGVDSEVVKFDKGVLKPTETKEHTGLTQAKVLGNVEKFDKGALKPTETKEHTGLTQAKVLGGVSGFSKDKLNHTQTKEHTGLTQAKVLGGVSGFNKDKLNHTEVKELSVEERYKLAKEGEQLEEKSE